MSTTTERTDPAVWIVLALVLLLLVPGALMMGFGGFGMMGGTGMGGWTGWGWSLGALVGLAVIVVALYFVVKAIQATGTRPAYAPYPYAVPPYATPPPGGPVADPRAILDARYAKGEITRDEYLRMRADLEGHAP